LSRRGFTLVECLVGLTLSLVVVTAGLQFFGSAQKLFLSLKEREESGQAALSAVDRMRIDLLHAGRGLAEETALGLVVPVSASDAELRTVSLEKRLGLAADAAAGESRLLLESTADIAAGQAVSMRDGLTGEIRTVAGIEGTAIVLDSPLGAGYAAATGVLALLENVAYFRDGTTRVLRRQVNASPAQPLLDNTTSASWSHDPEARLVRISIEIAAEGATSYGTTVFLKNPALAGIR
jgi:prepilin-type N-terminal cleavage/methylation domain-containing protein